MRRTFCPDADTWLIAFAFATGIAAVSAAQGRPLPDTLPRYKGVLPATADSVAVVDAVSDALQGRMAVTVPMRVTGWKHHGDQITVTLVPVEDPRVKWLNLGGVVDVLGDGRRVIVARM